MSTLSDEQLQKEFKRLDKDNNESISVEELRKYYLPIQEMLGVPPAVAEEEIQGLLKRLDSNSDGAISFDEFKEFMSAP